MYAREYGRGDRLFIAFHGWGGTHRDFVMLASRLPADARLLSFDLPGYGDSPEPEKWNLEAIAVDLEYELERRIGCWTGTLIGFCSGGLFPLLLARRKPESVSRVVMIDPFAYVPWYFRLFLWGEFGRRAYATTFQTGAGRAVTNMVFRWTQKQDVDFTASFRDIDHTVVRNYLKLFNLIDMRQFCDLHMPIDLLYGESTFAEVRKSVEWYCRLWPHARKSTLCGVGHLPLVKGARQLAAAIFTQEGGRQ